MMMVMFCSTALAWADQPTATTQPAAAPPSKWQYTLFDPTPSDQLRGMDTDRPNVTNTPHTIDAGHLQIETGVIDYTLYQNHTPGTNLRSDDFVFGEFNFRLGVLNNLEVNAVVNAYEMDRTRDHLAGVTTYASGYSDTSVGAKLNLWGNEGGDAVWTSALAIQPQFKLPTAQDGLGNGHFEFIVLFPFLVNLPQGFHLGVQPAVSYERNSTDSGYVTGLQNSISVDRVMLGNLDVYLEYASDVTTEQHVKAAQTIDVGGIYQLTNNIALDSGVNFGLNDQTPNLEVLAGISVRF